MNIDETPKFSMYRFNICTNMQITAQRKLILRMKSFRELFSATKEENRKFYGSKIPNYNMKSL